MNVMLEVQVEDVVKALAGDSSNDPAFAQAIAEANEAIKQGTSKDYIDDFVKAYERLSDGGSLAAIFVSPDRKDITLESSNADVAKLLKRETEAAIAASFNVLRSRIDHFGVTQPNIMRLPNSHRILVELPGVKEPQRVRDLLQGTASLEFWTTYDAREILPALAAADEFLRGELAAATEGSAVEVEQTEAVVAGQPAEGEGLIAEVGAVAGETAAEQTEGRFDRAQHPLFARLDPGFAGGAAVGAAYKADMAAVDAYLAQPAVREQFPADVAFKWGVKGDDKIDGRYYLYAIRIATPDGKAPLDGSVVTDARAQYAERGATAEVSMTMNAEGAQKWSRLTGENIGKCVAIVLDDYVYSAPAVRTKIDKGSSEISGDFTMQEAQDLANVLNSGKVPAPAKIIQDTVVGPSLGQGVDQCGYALVPHRLHPRAALHGPLLQDGGLDVRHRAAHQRLPADGRARVVRRRADAARYRRYRADDGYGRRRQRDHLRTHQGGAPGRQGTFAGHQGRFLEGLLGHHRR